MKHIDFYFDFISPYAYLAFDKLPETLLGLSYSVTYQPVLFAAMLKHHGQLGPAEIQPKRDWTYRQVTWLAHSQGVDLQMPVAHPFNPLPLLRLAVASSVRGTPNRYVCETLFTHVWQGGGDAADAQRLHALAEQITSIHDPNSAAARELLKTNTDAAIALGVFGVPTMAVDGLLFWGFDALPMLRDYLRGGPWFETSAWHAAAQVPVGVARAKR